MRTVSDSHAPPVCECTQATSTTPPLPPPFCPKHSTPRWVAAVRDVGSNHRAVLVKLDRKATGEHCVDDHTVRPQVHAAASDSTRVRELPTHPGTTRNSRTHTPTVTPTFHRRSHTRVQSHTCMCICRFGSGFPAPCTRVCQRGSRSWRHRPVFSPDQSPSAEIQNKRVFSKKKKKKKKGNHRTQQS